MPSSDGEVLAPLEQIRFEVGDDDTANPLFTDKQIEYKLSERAGNILATAADLCDVLATRYAKRFDFASQARMQFKVSQLSAAYAARAKALRERISGLTTVPFTRTDGYTDSVSARDGSAANTRTGRVRRGYSDPDLPV
ncbi:MAG: hypothetical protein ACRDK4_04980 [Solirubrobacteraceae bacterium]